MNDLEKYFSNNTIVSTMNTIAAFTGATAGAMLDPVLVLIAVDPKILDRRFLHRLAGRNRQDARQQQPPGQMWVTVRSGSMTFHVIIPSRSPCIWD